MNVLSDDVMAELQAAYVAGFAEKLTQIASAVASEDWKEAEELFHKMAGSGASYKMPEISTLARALELYLAKHSPPDRKVFDAAVKLFRKVLEERQQGRQQPVNEDPALQKILKAG